MRLRFHQRAGIALASTVICLLYLFFSGYFSKREKEECTFDPQIFNISFDFTILSWADLNARHAHTLGKFARFTPTCLPRSTAALIIPYRNRSEHLRVFLNNIHPFQLHPHLPPPLHRCPHHSLPEPQRTPPRIPQQHPPIPASPPPASPAPPLPSSFPTGTAANTSAYSSTTSTHSSFTPTCLPRSTAALIIPYRNRSEHLRVFLNNIHPFLQRQNIAYSIYVIEQVANQTFNRGKLINAGVVEALHQRGDFDCIIPHDVDALPEDDRNDYACTLDGAKHMAVARDINHYRMAYAKFFGGVNAFSVGDFKSVNGFANSFWGWGWEDDDLRQRFELKNITIIRPEKEIGRYTSLKHVRFAESGNEQNPCATKLRDAAKQRWRHDGLQSLRYRAVVQTTAHPLFNHVLVDLIEQKSKRQLEKEGICGNGSVSQVPVLIRGAEHMLRESSTTGKTTLKDAEADGDLEDGKTDMAEDVTDAEL